ncbi:MFS transporter [Paenibacillus lutimineralis]|uniref:MFS transporter n=1 Tax=Paenibacillus lutimineralis TaxID=2707005 RepID=A0A3Q9I7X5_9BACL|nr:MFS transporter [Paenibacillus lutimineralis]AZS14587.1 MFS transporter [Paenibacillus lutimineralis]
MKMTSKLVNKSLLTPTFVCLWIIMFLVEFVKGSLLVSVLPVYMGDVLKLSAFLIGLSFSLQYIGDNLFRSPAGWLVERLGFRMTMAVGLLITLGAVLILSFIKTVGFIVLGCALLGIGTAPLWPCVMMGISAVTKEKKNFGTAMGVIQISSLGGTGLGPIIINFLVSKSYTLVFWFLLACMVVVVIISLFLPGKGNKQVYAASRSEGQKGRLRALLQNIRHTLHHIRHNLKVSPFLYPALFLQTFAIGLLTPVITLYVRTELGLSPEAYSAMLIAGGGIAVAGLIPVGKLVDRYGTRLFLNVGFASAAISVCLFALTRSIPIVWILVILIGLSYSCILPTWDTMLSHLIPEREKGTVWGFFLTIQGFGMIIGPIVSGKLWDWLGPSAPFLASGCSMGLLFFVHLILSRPSYRLSTE